MRVEGEEKKDSNLKLYNPWFATEALIEKAFELSNAAPETYMEFQTVWMDTYQEAFGRLFETPTLRPFREPLKNAAKIYTDAFISTSNIWIKSYNISKKQFNFSKKLVLNPSSPSDDVIGGSEHVDYTAMWHNRAFLHFLNYDHEVEDAPRLGSLKGAELFYGGISGIDDCEG